MKFLSLNRELATNFLVDFVRAEVTKFGFDKVVLGLSGGIDSALSAAFAARALGPSNVLAYAMPHRDSAATSLEDAKTVADSLGIPLEVVDITAAVEALREGLACDDAVGLGNIKARTRMICLYEKSRSERALVLGTSNKTELLLGYGTQHADMASGLNPLGDLYKTQVFALSEHIGLPRAVIDKPPSADLWVGQKDEDELGFTYAEVDRLLVRMIDRRESNDDLVEDGFTREFVERIRAKVRNAQYKRQAPILAKVGLRTIGIDFLYHRDWGR
ncbi:MAG: NAD+ synthase [Planctomycetes bacterium]|nr:NAD+ synthase [Planctomycetota bacterium]